MLINPLENINIAELTELTSQFFTSRIRYKAAIRKVRTYLQILNDEFNVLHQRNPIHHLSSRIKDPVSIAEKLKRKGFPVTLESAITNLTDIAGVRIVCSYLEDVYKIADLVKHEPGFRIIRESDYIKTPKSNGYRSLHFIISVPVVVYEKHLQVPVELQIRTIAMDFWASLEHRLRYKNSTTAVPVSLETDLIKAANDIAAIDLKMQKLYNETMNLYPETQAQSRIQMNLVQSLMDEEELDIFFPLNK